VGLHVKKYCAVAIWRSACMIFAVKTSRKVIVTRTESDRTANGIRLDGERNLIGRRTESDWTANGIRSDGGRNLIGRRTESDRTADGNRLDGERERWHT
jgi:hypothetical protein